MEKKSLEFIGYYLHFCIAGILALFATIACYQENSVLVNGKYQVVAVEQKNTDESLVPCSEVDYSIQAHNKGEIDVCVFVRVDMPHHNVIIPSEKATRDAELFVMNYINGENIQDYNTSRWTDVTDYICGEDNTGFSHWYAYINDQKTMEVLRQGEKTEELCNQLQMINYQLREDDNEAFPIDVNVEVHSVQSDLIAGMFPEKAWDKMQNS